MPTIVSTANAEHYTWGGPASGECDAWYLVRTPALHVIEELMPPGAAETPHHHGVARQFFFVLEGQLTIALGREVILLRTGEGLEVAPGSSHQAINNSPAPVRFLVVSQPPSHDDRVEDDATCRP